MQQILDALLKVLAMDRFIIPFGNVAKPHLLKLWGGGGPIVIVHV